MTDKSEERWSEVLRTGYVLREGCRVASERVSQRACQRVCQRVCRDVVH